MCSFGPKSKDIPMKIFQQLQDIGQISCRLIRARGFSKCCCSKTERIRESKLSGIKVKIMILYWEGRGKKTYAGWEMHKKDGNFIFLNTISSSHLNILCAKIFVRSQVSTLCNELQIIFLLANPIFLLWRNPRVWLLAATGGRGGRAGLDSQELG